MSEDLKSCPFCGDVAMLELIARIRELEGAVTKSADDHEALLREWMYTPFVSAQTPSPNGASPERPSVSQDEPESSQNLLQARIKELESERDALRDRNRRLKEANDKEHRRLVAGKDAQKRRAVRSEQKARDSEARAQAAEALLPPWAWAGGCGHVWNRESPKDPCPTCAAEGELARMREALTRLGSMEAFTISRCIDKERDAELLARIDFARQALLPSDQSPTQSSTS